MGEFSASDCSWKKTVLTRNSEKEWSANSKSCIEMGSDTTSFSLDYFPGPIQVKEETQEKTPDRSFPTGNDSADDVQIMIQEVDPLLVERDDMSSSTGINRRRGSLLKNETPEEREIRLAKMSAYARARIANETPEQRALRLRRMSEYAAKRLSNESKEQRNKRLARMSEYAAQRLARESPEQRSARLARMSAYAAKRHAMKSAERRMHLVACSLDSSEELNKDSSASNGMKTRLRK